MEFRWNFDGISHTHTQTQQPWKIFKTFTYSQLCMYINMNIYIYVYVYEYVFMYRLHCKYIYTYHLCCSKHEKSQQWIVHLHQMDIKKMGPQTICSAVSLTTFKQTSLTPAEWKPLLKVQVIFWKWKRFWPPKMGVQARTKIWNEQKSCRNLPGWCWILLDDY